MKRFLLLLLFVNIFILNAQEKVIIANGEWKPYLSKELKHGGVSTHIVTEAFKNVDIEVEYKWYGDSWKRAYVDAKNGKTDGTCIWSYKPERAQEMYYSKYAVLEGKRDLIFHLKDMDFDWQTVEDLYDYKIGITSGYTYGEEVDTAIENGKITVDKCHSEKLNFEKLLNERFDLLISGQKVAKKIIEENFSQAEANKIVSHPKPIRVVSYHLLLTKKNPDNKKLMEKFDKGLKMLIDSGKLEQFYKDSKIGKYNK